MSPADGRTWRCWEHQQGTNVLDHPPMEREVCWGSESDPLDLPCRWAEDWPDPTLQAEMMALQREHHGSGPTLRSDCNNDTPASPSQAAEVEQSGRHSDEADS